MIYTFYTDTHKIFLDNWFMKTIKEKDKVHVEKFEQECLTGVFGSNGWRKAMLKKVNYIRECLTQPDPFFYLDCDIQFFDSFYDDYMKIMENNNLDVLGQHDSNRSVCCGFMLIRPSDKMRKLWDKVYEEMKRDTYKCDQAGFNNIHHQYKLNFMFLGQDCFSIWMTNGIRVWKPSHEIKLPNIKLKTHHANFTVGIENKIKLMEVVKKTYEKTRHVVFV